MRDYDVVDANVENIGDCAFCGYKRDKNEGHRRKCDWLKKRFAEGLRYKVLRSRECGDVGMIEYAPGSHAWRPVEAEGYLVIHCLMIPKCVDDIAAAARALGLEPKVVRVRNARQSRGLPTPYGVFSTIYKGRLIAERPVSGARFRNIMSKLA